MRLGLQNWLHTHWYGTRRPPWYLRGLEPVYKAAWQYQHREPAAGKETMPPGPPRVVVGNITAGGSGKTPLVMALCQLARELGLEPGIASTGYARHSNETILVRPGSDPYLCGDEPLLLAECTVAPVVVASQRGDALTKLGKMDLGLIISDDGLQTPGIKWDITLCVVDGERGTGNGHLLPAGPLREPLQRLYGVDYVISKGDWAGAPQDLDTYTMHLCQRRPRSLDDDSVVTIAELLKQTAGGQVHALAGIANPQPFFAALENQGFTLTRHCFADHHTYRREDFDSMRSGATIIMTAKDAVKCRGFGLRNAWYVPVAAQLPDAFRNSFKEKIKQLQQDSLWVRV